MASNSLTQSAFLAPAAAAASPSPQPRDANNIQRRQATLYDAVAARIGPSGFLPHANSLPSLALAPDILLHQRLRAPLRYEETDAYFASSRLPSDSLPDRDLLKALHAYASEYYARTTGELGAGEGGKGRAGRLDFRSLDETALVALGVLMEELCGEALGETGDLVFTEAAGEEGGGGGEEGARSRRGSRSRSQSRASKRRKVSERGDG